MTIYEQQAREIVERCVTAYNTSADPFTDVILRELNLASLLEDKAIVNHMEKLKTHHVGHWTEDGWQNPYVSWKVYHSVPDGTYNFPKELAGLSFRTAIANAIKEESK